MQLQFSPLAQADLEAIGDYIAQDSPANAVRFLQSLQTQCQRIAKAPRAYVARPELGEDLHSCAYGRYVIFFWPQEDLIRIERILHGARDISAGLSPEGSADEPQQG